MAAHPHDRYLVFLLSEGWEPYEIQAKCRALSLPEPELSEIETLRDGLGMLPPTWARVLTVSNTSFARWLRDQGLLDLWRNPPAVKQAFQVLRSTHLRRAVEGMLLVSPNPERVRDSLVGKFSPSEIPSPEAIECFRVTWWDFSNLPSGAAFDYIGSERNKKLYATRPEVHYGLVRDERTVRAAVGLPAEPEDDVSLIERLLAHMSQRIEQVSRDVDGNDQRGRAEVASYAASLPRLLETRDKAKKGSGSTAATIRMRMSRPTIRAIPSIDDIHRMSEDTTHERATGTGRT